ncbi:MAG: cation-transporting P-type ATPase [Clostridia bacterium]|nr:cation-transporting P-type ATPase [Clostridia bacterium]
MLQEQRCLIIWGSILSDQSTLNGESREVKKYPSTPMGEFIPDSPDCVFRGSLVCEGEGILRCEKVGKDTLYGRIALELKEQKRQSPLKLRLEALARTVSKIGYIAAVVVALTYLFNVWVIDSGFSLEVIKGHLSDWHFISTSLIKAVTIAITVIVVAVPEGLPMMITVILSSNMKRMLRSGVLIRKPVGIETAGSMNVLFTDKTGTITSGKLSVSSVITAEGIQYKKISSLERHKISRIFLPSILCNCDATFIDGEIQGGNSTDRALLSFVGKRDMPLESIEHLPFDSKRKFSSSLLPGLTVYKGAPERIIPLCSSAYDENGNVVPFRTKAEITKKVEELSSCLSRVIAIATHPSGSLEALEEGMIFLCIINILDPIRPQAQRALKRLKGAGIHCVMITGDSALTAEAIAEEVGIIDQKSQGEIIDSSALSKMSDGELQSLLPRLAVVARALPSDKSRLVKVAENMGYVAGMTGDGVNDAPALKKADVGFCMGSGTDIAKEASDIVILDNDLSSIANAVLFGRTIFKSIRKFILFQLTMNLSAVGVSLVGQLLGIDAPVTVIQMLWVNIIMDTLGGIAFAGEAPLERYMKEKPKKRDEPIFSPAMLWRIVLIGAYVVLMCSLFLASSKAKAFFSYDTLGPLPFMTAFFALFIFTGIGVSFISRADGFFTFSGIEKNKLFVFIMLFVSAVQLSMIYFGADVFRCTPLSPKSLLLVALLSLSVFPADLVRKICTKLLKK